MWHLPGGAVLIEGSRAASTGSGSPSSMSMGVALNTRSHRLPARGKFSGIGPSITAFTLGLRHAFDAFESRYMAMFCSN